MEKHVRTLRFNANPLNFFLSSKRKKGLRIGYMEAALQGFYLNSISTGVHSQKLSDFLSKDYDCADNESITEVFRFLINEGDRVPYQIMLPYLLSASNIHEFENIISKHFSKVEQVVQQEKNLYKFLRYTEERKDPVIWISDLQRGIIGWDMGLLVGLTRAALGSGYITKEKAWGYIEKANMLCTGSLYTPEEIDKSYLLGRAMKSDKIEDWDRVLTCYSLLERYH